MNYEKINTGIELTFELLKREERMGGKERFSSSPRYLQKVSVRAWSFNGLIHGITLYEICLVKSCA